MIAALIVGAFLTPRLSAQAGRLAGHWEGALVMVPAEQEVDVVLDFQEAAGRVKGHLTFPVTLDGRHEVENLTAQGSQVSFAVHDADGALSAFTGTLAPDGDRLQGTMTESGQTIPFTLHRVKAAPPAREVPTYKLVNAQTELKETFNHDAGKVRMLLLLNPSSFSSKMALRIVERFVLEQIGDPDLRVYVVWMAPDRKESAQLVKLVAALAPDPRVTHFWSTDRALDKVFEPMLALYKPVSNPCLLFGADRAWTEPAPLPDRLRQTANGSPKSPVDPAQKLNGLDLAADVRRLLAARSGH
jgi:hypothetical protein